MSRVSARVEQSLAARVIVRTPLLYGRGADQTLDRPAHVRSGSALVRIGAHQLAVVQDDASFIAILEGIGDPVSPVTVRDLALPAPNGVRLFDKTRGNKHAKLDLEAAVLVNDGALLIAFGSGSTDARERVVLVERPSSAEPTAVVVEAHALYAALQSDVDFVGSELNIEGAVLAGDDILLLQRGNGARLGTRLPIDATARFDCQALIAHLTGLARNPAQALPCPPLRGIVQWDLGRIGGTRLTFTDGVALRGPWTCFLACAEASPDATRDGPVSGVALGRLDDRRGLAELAIVTDERGAVLLDKAEGVAFDDADPRRAWLVIDRDDPHAPAELLELSLGEGWSR